MARQEAMKGAGQRMPLRVLGAFDPDWAALAMQVTAEIDVALQLAMKWQDPFKAPFVVAERCPLREIGRYPADRDRRVYRRTPAGQLAPEECASAPLLAHARHHATRKTHCTVQIDLHAVAPLFVRGVDHMPDPSISRV